MSQDRQTRPRAQSKLTYLIKTDLKSASSVARSLSPSPATPSRRPKRSFSSSELSPTDQEKSAKMSKIELDEIKSKLTAQEEKADKSERNLLEAIKNMGESITNSMKADNQTRFDDLTAQMTEIKTKQDKEATARLDIEAKVVDLQKQQSDMAAQLDQVQAAATPDTEELAKLLLPLVLDQLGPEIKTSLAKEIGLNTAQANASYCQSLVAEIKQHETGLMIYGHTPDDGTDLETNIRTKVFKDIMELDIGYLKVFKFTSRDSKPPSIRVTLGSSEIRNTILSRGRKLPKGIRIEKCLPQKYRQKNKDFLDYGFQLKQIRNNIKTRTIFKAHKLVLEMREVCEDGKPKGDWMEMKEFYPPPEMPGDTKEVTRSRLGLTGTTKPLTPEEQNVVIFSNLVFKTDKPKSENYFVKEYLTEGDDQKVTKVQCNIEKKVMVVSLVDMQACKDFASKYTTIPFNESNPKVAIMLGGKNN